MAFRKKHSYDKDSILSMCIPEPNTGCWLWTSKPNHSGYGRIYIDGKQSFAHRVSFELFNNTKIPDGMLVCHKCDNPICVNPEHLFLGTNQDNMTDMVKKGRAAIGDRNTSRKNPHLQVRGSKAAAAKLNEAQVVEIKKLLKAGGKLQKEIAEMFGVNSRTINVINVGKNWRHV